MFDIPEDGAPVNIVLNVESCRVDFQTIKEGDGEPSGSPRGLEIIYHAARTYSALSHQHFV